MADEDVKIEEIETPEPKYVCGVVVSLLPGGNGVQFDLLNSQDYSRRASLTDLNMMANHLADHTRAVMTSAQIVEIIQQQSIMQSIRSKKLN